MFKKLKARQAHNIAELANSARARRDTLLRGVAEEIGSGPHPAKGESDRAGPGGFDVLPTNDPVLSALRDAITSLQPDARSELFALMRIGQGELAKGDWGRGLSEAETLGNDTVGGILADDVDLSNHLSKALYELDSAEPPPRAQAQRHRWAAWRLAAGQAEARGLSAVDHVDGLQRVEANEAHALLL